MRRVFAVCGGMFVLAACDLRQLSLAGELIENTPANLARWIAHPEVLQPSSYMPNLHLWADQVWALVA